MHINTINLMDILEDKFEKDQAKIIAKAIDEAIGESVQQQATVLATKEDIANLKVELTNIKSELIKWMFIFWLGQIGVLTGIIFAMLKIKG
ncbi:MAG: hypothetical protein MAG551_00193 [Candidatus Scalindua arabica]|uniref:DUF1640 domain-containing protein n=1 Tax=Candidatus Scalindua arabica TaxID=1127984 RepID=A0A941VYJ3_9BACT|nr:hypothetical protein [Candidatus Scalindua arabica]